MAVSNDLRGRTRYSAMMAAIGLPCLAWSPATLVLIAFLAMAFTYEVAVALKPRDHDGMPAALVLLAIGLGGFAFAGYFRVQENGLYTVLLVAVSVFATDTFAYLGGRRFGKTPLAPRISPKKTVEGVLCGMTAGATVLVLGWLALDAHDKTSLPIGGLLALMLVLPPSAVVGDLLASKTKRMLGRKDFSNTLGPHGGVADRCDALTAAFVVYGIVSLLT